MYKSLSEKCRNRPWVLVISFVVFAIGCVLTFVYLSRSYFLENVLFGYFKLLGAYSGYQSVKHIFDFSPVSFTGLLVLLLIVSTVLLAVLHAVLLIKGDGSAASAKALMIARILLLAADVGQIIYLYSLELSGGDFRGPGRGCLYNLITGFVVVAASVMIQLSKTDVQAESPSEGAA